VQRRISVAIPTKNAGPLLAEVLQAVGAQRTARDVELVVCDSGSTDGTVRIAEHHGARVLRIPPEAFGHGRTRNLLMEETRGETVLFLTQDATPARTDWLERLAGAIETVDDVAIACGPYVARPDATPMVARELEDFFRSLSPDGGTVVTRAPGGDTSVLGAEAIFHTDANAAVRRSAWRAVPFRDIAYAEDQALCLDVLRAGWGRAFTPAAPVVHSHDYGFGERFRRIFDEFRALREVHGVRTSAHPRHVLGDARRQVARDRAWAAARDPGARASGRLAVASAAYHLERAAAAAVGSRAEALPYGVQRRLSHERRAGTPS
jgi:rhamnosyltransferase